MAFLDTQDVDLDAVLGELCALESQYQSTASLMDAEKNGKYLVVTGLCVVLTTILFLS